MVGRIIIRSNMLGSDSGIKHTILQANNMQGLDDVVQVYENGLARCIQVKHTRVSNTLTFGDLVSKDEDEKGRSSKTLLQSICKDWHDAKIKKRVAGDNYVYQGI